MSTSLAKTGARGGGITILGQGIRILVQFVGVVILSRLLAPSDFGLVAMVAVFMTLADLLRDFGLPSAALQAKSLSHQQASNMFWASSLLGALCALVLALCAPIIADFYSEPRLAQVVPALAVAVLMSGFQAQIQVQLARNLRFGILALSSVAASAAGLLVATLAALGGLGYWALVLQSVVTPVVLLAIRAPAARWLPTWPRRGHGSRSLFVSGMQLGVAYLLTWAASNADSMVLGARWGATTLGYYNRGWQIVVSPMSSILAPLTQVALPMLNKAERVGRHTFEVLLRLQVLVVAPSAALMVALALTAPSLVPLVLGEQWAPAIMVVQILAAGECIHALSYISYWGFLAERLSKQLLHYNLVTKPMVVVFVLIGSNFGLAGVAWAYVAGLAVSWPINLVWLSRKGGMPGLAFFTNGIRVLVTGGIVFVALQFSLGSWIASQSWAAVIVGLCSAFTLFVGVLAVTSAGRHDLSRMVQIARSIR